MVTVAFRALTMYLIQHIYHSRPHEHKHYSMFNFKVLNLQHVAVDSTPGQMRWEPSWQQTESWAWEEFQVNSVKVGYQEAWSELIRCWIPIVNTFHILIWLQPTPLQQSGHTSLLVYCMCYTIHMYSLQSRICITL